MKTKFAPQCRNGILVLTLTALFNVNLFAQDPPPLIAEVRLMKVEPRNAAEFEKQAKEVWRPVNQSRKQSGRIVAWQFYKVDFAGTADEYNYAAVIFYNDWRKTEPDEHMGDAIRTALPKADANAIMAKASSLVQIVRSALYRQVDAVSKPDAKVKYIMINFMKVKEGMNDTFITSETKDWKPVHKEMVDTGKRAGWGLWAHAFPGGTGNSHDYVTTDNYESYGQLFESQMDALKKVYPNQEVAPFFTKTGKTRDIVKQELWQLLEITD
jgi:hypothetical protein